jgi:hypothetical protein
MTMEEVVSDENLIGAFGELAQNRGARPGRADARAAQARRYSVLATPLFARTYVLPRSRRSRIARMS